MISGGVSVMWKEIHRLLVLARHSNKYSLEYINYQKHSLLLPNMCDLGVKAYLRNDVLAGCCLLRDHQRSDPKHSKLFSVGMGSG